MFELTVIIPSHNKKDYITRCLDSIYMQTYQPKSVIVFDDRSTDGTVTVLKEYHKIHPTLSLILSEKNVGVSAARDYAIRKAATEYVTFIDADDYYYDPNKLANEMATVERVYKLKGVECCAYSQTVLVDMSERRLDRKKLQNWDKHLRSGIVARLYRYWVPRDFCFPKKLYEEVGGFDYNLRLYEDWDLVLRLYAKTEFCFAGGYGTAYRLETGGLSSVQDKLHFEKKKYVYEKNKNVLKCNCVDDVLFYSSLYLAHFRKKIIRKG